MKRASSSGIAAAVVVLFAGGIAGAVTPPEGDEAKAAHASAGSAKKFKKLAARVRVLSQQVAALEAERGAGRPPAGEAGGDLGGSYPAPEIAPNAVGAAELQPASVAGPAIAADAVSAASIAPAAVGTAELASGAVNSANLATGAVGAPAIADGGVGAAEIGSSEVRSAELGELVPAGNSVSIPPGGVDTIRADCPTGSQLISGGAYFTFASGELSESAAIGNSWFASGQNGGTQAQNLAVQAYCLTTH